MDGFRRDIGGVASGARYNCLAAPSQEAEFVFCFRTLNILSCSYREVLEMTGRKETNRCILCLKRLGLWSKVNFEAQNKDFLSFLQELVK